MTTVSYTHLDVYKRQIVDRPFGVGKSHILPAAAVRGRRFSVAAADKAENTEYQ